MQPNQPQRFGVVPSPTPFEMRPDAATFWGGVGARALILLPLAALGIFNAVQRDGVGWAVVLYVGLAAVLLVGVLIMLQTSSILLTDQAIEMRRLLLPPRVIARSRIAHGVLVPQYSGSFDRTAPLLILVNAKGRALLRVTGQIFDAGAVFTLAERIGLQHFDVISGVVGPKAIAARHPKAIPLFERRPALVVILGTVVLLVLIVIGVSIFDTVPD
ncbi:hypothetical protein ABIB25_004389 [Nakamurella sp. UYEF19]|uniref:hypothetical protein n=1 Tax=Nakamurella sp. UYEF19 TaxID=1756392 RepID=UPI003399887A